MSEQAMALLQKILAARTDASSAHCPPDTPPDDDDDDKSIRRPS